MGQQRNVYVSPQRERQTEHGHRSVQDKIRLIQSLVIVVLLYLCYTYQF